MEPKRLYKGHEKMLCGVCSGIAEYFNLDPTLVRRPSSCPNRPITAEKENSPARGPGGGVLFFS